MSADSFAGFVSALASGDAAAIAAHYRPDARSYGPLAWPSEGSAIAAGLAEAGARLDGLEIELHDAFTNADQDRAALRLVRRWTEGDARLSAIETRYLQLADELIEEEFAGPNTFQIAGRELNQWGRKPAVTEPDPSPEILAASETETSGKAPETVAERFVNAFGRNDPDALIELYDRGFVLYSPIAWGLAGRDPLVPFVQQFHHGFPGLRLALFDQFASADGGRIAFRFGMRWHNTGTFFGLEPTGNRGAHAEFHSLRLSEGRIVEQVVTDVSYSIPQYELTVWQREYPTETEDPAPVLLSS
jgi:hypothetical protein